MAFWVARAGKNGENEERALQGGLAVIGWSEMPDLSQFPTRKALKNRFMEIWPDATPHSAGAQVGQLWAFARTIQESDWIALPQRTTGLVAVGKVTGPYEYRPDLVGEDCAHTRKVDWERDDLPRTTFPSDIRYSLGAARTVFSITRNDAEKRLAAIIRGDVTSDGGGSEAEEDEGDTEAPLDVRAVAATQIETYIATNFKGHAMARLVDAILQAQGYRTQLSSPGPDGGVDIIAGSGPLGFDSPRLCVQVKSSDAPVDMPTLTQLQGSLDQFNAEYGLLVSWGGFRKTVISTARQLYFRVRLWDSSALMSALTASYERLPESVQAEIPLERVWAPLQDEAE